MSPARQFVEVFGTEPIFLLKGIAAALSYDVQSDEEAVQVQTTIREQGIEAAIMKYTELDSTSILFKGIVEQYQQLT